MWKRRRQTVPDKPKRTSAWKQHQQTLLKAIRASQMWQYRALILAGRLERLGQEARDVIDEQDKERLQQMLLQANREADDETQA
jgi:hypothetical protein